MAEIGTNDKEGFVEMIARMQSEGDHGLMTKDEWDALVAKWMGVYKDIKDKAESPLLLTYEDVKNLY